MANELAQTSILIVDTIAEARNVQEALSTEGFENLSVLNEGLKVIPEIRKNKPQIMIVNIALPKFSGMQILNVISKEKSLASIKFIMTTSRLNRRELEQLKKDGVKIVVQRPISAEQLREKIFSMFGMSADLREDAAKDFYKAGMESFKKGDYENALEAFKQASEGNRNEAAYLFMQGRCYFELDLFDKAISAFVSTSKIDSKYPELNYWRGMALQKRREYLASVQMLKRAAEEDSSKSGILMEMGKSYLGADMKAEADQSFAAAIKLDPNDIDIRTSIGNAYLDKELYGNAEKAFGDAIDVNPENIHLYNRMGIAARKQGKYREAIYIYMKAMKVDPRDEGILYNLSRALWGAGQKEKALKVIDMALSIYPDFGEAKKLREKFKTGN